MASSKSPVNAGNSGSPTAGGPVVYLMVGALRRAHGVHGNFVVEVMTDFPERLKPGTFVYLGEKKQPLKITSRGMHNEGLVLGFENITTPEQTTKYRNQNIFVKAEDRPELPEGEYYHHQILGMQVVEDTGRLLGTINEILVTGANDVYVIATPDAPSREILLPAIQDVILDVNLTTKTMRVHLLPGLLDGEESGDETAED